MEVRNAQKAIDIAIKFVKERQYFFARPKKAFLDTKKKVWTVRLDVGIFEDRVITLKINASNGDIIEFTDEEK